MPTSFGAESGVLFNQGFANGLRARQQREERKEQERTRPMRDAEKEIDIRRKRQIADEFDLEQEIQKETRKRGAQNWVEAEKAFQLYTDAVSNPTVDQASPDYPKVLQAITTQYLPTILKDTNVAKKWEAMDSAMKGGQVMTLKKVQEIQQLGMARELASRGIPLPTGDSGPDWERAHQLIKEDDAEKFDRALQLRGEATRLRSEMGGGTSRAAGSRLSQSQAAQLDILKKEADRINADIAKLREGKPGAPGSEQRPDLDKRRDLEMQRAKVMRMIRAFDTPEESAPAEASPEAAPMNVRQPARGGPAAPAAPAAPGREGEPAVDTNNPDVWQQYGPFKVRVKQ